jgi:molecular chaperone GrpE (heat shock protein)
MKIDTNIIELENIIENNLLVISGLRHNIEQKELEKQDLLKKIALGIIDVIDSFERIEEKSITQEQNKDEKLPNIRKRYQIIQTKLIYLLQKYGITKIEFPEKQLIVGLCEVVETENDNSKENDEIVSIVKNGYIRGEKLIRAAQVIIVKN